MISRFPGVRNVLFWLLVLLPPHTTHPVHLVYGMRILLLQCRRQKTGQRLRPMWTLPTNLQVHTCTQICKLLGLMVMQNHSACSTFVVNKIE